MLESKSDKVNQYIEMTKRYTEAIDGEFTPEQEAAMIEEGHQFFMTLSYEEKAEATKILLKYLSNLIQEEMGPVPEDPSNGFIN